MSKETVDGCTAMADATADEVEEEKKPSKLPLILGVVGLLAGGGGGFFATYSGMIMGEEEGSKVVKDPGLPVAPLPKLEYIPLEPMIISVGRVSEGRHLRFGAQLEVAPEYKADVEALMPRIVDVLNGYLRALTIEDLDKPAALVRLRGQMLRRIQVVTGIGRVNDFLVMEFVLN